jgi:hypothetical protein
MAVRPTTESAVMAKSHSLSHIASVLGIHRNTIAGWLKKGCPSVQAADPARGVEWKLEIPAVFAWRIDHAVKDALASYADAAGGISKDEADRRRAVALAIVAEIEADEALKSVVSRQDAEADMASFCQTLKQGLSNASARIASRATSMTNAPEIQDLVQEELNRSFRAAQGELATRWGASGSKG